MRITKADILGITLTLLFASVIVSLISSEDDHNNNWNGAVDRQSAVAGSECTAYHKPTGRRLTVVQVTIERGGIMERYKVKEYGGSTFYAEAFTDLKCKSIFDNLFN